MSKADRGFSVCHTIGDKKRVNGFYSCHLMVFSRGCVLAESDRSAGICKMLGTLIANERDCYKTSAR